MTTHQAIAAWILVVVVLVGVFVATIEVDKFLIERSRRKWRKRKP